MADPIELAKTARGTLAQALSALQSYTDAPDDLMEIAAPIAQAMGVLHRVEKSGGEDLAEVPGALDKVRGALDALQSTHIEHDAVDDAMEHVAGSLAKLFSLAKEARHRARASGAGQDEAPPAAAYKAPEPVAPAQPATNPEPAVARQAQKTAPSEPPRSAPPRPAAKASPLGQAPQGFKPTSKTVPEDEPPLDQTIPERGHAAAPAVDPTGPTQAAPTFTARGTVKLENGAGIAAGLQAQAAAAPPEGQSGGLDMPQAAPAPPAQAAPAHTAPAPTAPLPPNAPSFGGPTQAQAPAAPPGQGTQRERVPGMTDAPVPSTGTHHIEVELGAYSSSNFYKGLSGNDVVEHGGIFVQTYQIPAVGAAVALRILLPGDLEFDADALVQWTRETRSGESDPGFGAKFTRISDEGRQLVYRYVRNREPMFYDDL